MIVISSWEVQKKMGNIDVNKKSIMVNDLIESDRNGNDFNALMSIYQMASDRVLEMIDGIAVEYNKMFNRKIINHRITRIKEKKSIVDKMKKKNLELSYENLVDNIHDIAGVRVICHTKNDVYTLAKIIEKIPNWNLINVKDYIKNPKKSGYSGYHLIVEVPVRLSEIRCLSNQIFVKVEIQIRTMAMDFWATNEHKMKYKTDKKLSFFDSKRLVIYAKVLNAVEDKLVRISNRNSTTETVRDFNIGDGSLC